MQTAADISEDTSQICESIAREIQKQFADYKQSRLKAECLIMLDPALRNAEDDPEFAHALRAWRTATEFHMPFPRIVWRHPNLLPSHAPYFISIDPNQAESIQLIESSVQIAFNDWQIDSLSQHRGHRISGWLMAQTHPAPHLGHLTVRRLPAGDPHAGKKTLLRFYDPSVMPWIWKISDASQSAQLLGPIQTWLMLDGTHRLQSYTVNAVSVSNIVQALRYRTDQWLELHNIGPLNQALLQWRIRTNTLPNEAQIRAIKAALVRARQYGIHDEQDLTTFALHAFEIHPHFDAHPLMRQALKQLPHEKYYTAAIAGFTAPVWQRIQSDLSIQSSPAL